MIWSGDKHFSFSSSIIFCEFIRIKENENVWNQHDLPCSIFVLFLLFSLEAYFLILPKGNVDVIKKKRKKENREHINILRKVPFNICKHVWHIIRRHNDIYITSRLCPPSFKHIHILKTSECIYKINRSRRTFIYGWWHKQYNNPLLLSDEEEHTHNYWIAQTKISSKYWALNPPSMYAHIRIYK